MSDWSRAGYWRVETLVSTNLHVADKIQELFHASRAFGFGISLLRAAKIMTSLIGVVRVRRGSRMRFLR